MDVWNGVDEIRDELEKHKFRFIYVVDAISGQRMEEGEIEWAKIENGYLQYKPKWLEYPSGIKLKENAIMRKAAKIVYKIESGDVYIYLQSGEWGVVASVN